MTSEEIRILIDQEALMSKNPLDPFATLQDMWVPMQNQSWMYIGLGISKE